jgi:hypothetical protein
VSGRTRRGPRPRPARAAQDHAHGKETETRCGIRRLVIGKGGFPQLLRHRVLGGDTLYRVVGVAGELVEVEVVSAPGLDPGTRVRLTQAAIATMSVVPESSLQRPTQGAATDEPVTHKPRRKSAAE